MERGTDQANHRTEAAPQEVTISEAQADHLWGVRHHALYRCQLSTRYHRRRERFLDWMHRATSAAALIGGSAAFAAATQPAVVRWAALAVAVTSVCALVFGFADKARRHAALAESYKRIEADILRAGDYDFTEAQVNGWRAQLAETEAGEPPVLRALVVLCQNDIAGAASEPQKITDVPWHQRLFAQVIDFDVNTKAERDLCSKVQVSN